MLIKLCSWVGRNRVAVLVIAVILAAGLGVLRADTSQESQDLGFAAGTVVLLGAFVLAAIALSGYHPAVLEVRPQEPAFVNLPQAGQVLLAAALTSTSGANAVSVLLDGERAGLFSRVVTALWVLLIALLWWTVFRDQGIRVRPTGIEDRHGFGTLFVPWVAFTGVERPAYANGRDKVALHFARAGSEPIRKTGWRPAGYRSALPSAALDSRFLAFLIHEYAHHPEHRSAIGTEAEWERLATEWANQSTETP